MAVPRTPEAFIESYLPARVAELGNAGAPRSTPGSVGFRLDDGVAWSLRLGDGNVVVTSGLAVDRVVTVSMDRASFEPVVVRGAERGELAPAGRRATAARMLDLTEERANLVRNMAGSIALVIKDDEREHQIVATPGLRALDEKPACTLRLQLDDLTDLQLGRAQPLQLMMMGALVIEGDAQLVMNLVAALSA